MPRCVDHWHTAASQPGSEMLYVSICGEHLWQMGDTLKSHWPLHFPKEQLPGTTNHSSVHYTSLFPLLLHRLLPQQGRALTQRTAVNDKAVRHMKRKKAKAGWLERGSCRGGFRYVGRWENQIYKKESDMQPKECTVDTHYPWLRTGMNYSKQSNGEQNDEWV